MKAQTLGLILGMNMAVACLVMQGCKAVKPGQELPPEPTTTTTVDVTTEPTPAPSAKAPGADIKTETTPPPPPPPTTREIGKLPPPPKAEPAKKPASAPSAAPAAAAAESPVVHTVQRGELLSSISKKYNVKMSAIVAANPGLNPDRIRIGQKLKIPAKAAAEQKSGVMLASAPAPKAANIAAPVKTKPAFKAYTGPTKDYVVKGGDSLGKIALENGITIRALKEMNGLKKDNVRVGQKLKVPAEKPAAEKKVEPAKKPAEAKPADGAALKPEEAKKDAAASAPKEEAPKPDAAPAASDEQKPAETAAAAPAASDEQKPAETAAAPTGGTYVVQEGEDVVAVSIKWGISPSQLLNANDLKEGEQLKAGQVLKLPPNAKQASGL